MGLVVGARKAGSSPKEIEDEFGYSREAVRRISESIHIRDKCILCYAAVLPQNTQAEHVGAYFNVYDPTRKCPTRSVEGLQASKMSNFYICSDPK
jgi:hypothetical protein